MSSTAAKRLGAIEDDDGDGDGDQERHDHAEPSAGLCSQKKATDHSTPTTSWMKNQIIASLWSSSLPGVRQASHAARALSA